MGDFFGKVVNKLMSRLKLADSALRYKVSICYQLLKISHFIKYLLANCRELETQF